jgi:hypothetical protein
MVKEAKAKMAKGDKKGTFRAAVLAKENGAETPLI